MKRTAFLFVILAALSAASGYLMSKSTWIGKVGMTFFHKSYNLTKVWWQGAVAVFIVFLLLFLLHTLLHLKLSVVAGRIAHFILLMAAVAALYFNYNDFHTDISHRMLGWRFHYGFYLGWIGWMCIGIFFLFKKKDITPATTYSDRKDAAIQ